MLQKENHRDLQRIKVLNEKLNAAKVACSSVEASNGLLRKQIDNIRKDKLAYDDQTRSTKKKLAKLEQEAESTAREAQYSVRVDTAQRKKIVELSEGLQEERQSYYERLSQMGSVLQDEKNKKGSGTLNAIALDRDAGDAESTRLIEMLADKWVGKMKEQKKTYEEYVRHAKALHAAMEHITDRTGISNGNELVVSFISSFEESEKLTNYILRLNDQIDAMANNIADMEQLLSAEDKSKELSEQEKMNLLQKIQSQSSNAEENYNEANEQTQLIMDALSGLKSHFVRLKDIFAEFGVSASMSSGLTYNEADMILNTKTTPEYLFELEQLIGKFLAYIHSQKSTISNPEVVMLDVNSLKPKDFGQGDAVTIKEFLERDMMLGSEEDTVPLTAEQMAAKINEIIPESQTPAVDDEADYKQTTFTTQL